MTAPEPHLEVELSAISADEHYMYGEARGDWMLIGRELIGAAG